MKKYKLIAGPTTSQIISGKGDNSEAVASFSAIIEQNAQNGWTYHSMEPITTSQTKGCLFNKQTIVMTFYMLIFEKDE